MNIQCFAQINAPGAAFFGATIVKAHDLAENAMLDVDANGKLSALTMKHAKSRADFTSFLFEQVAA